MSKSPDAFRTISEVAEWLGVQAHVLRFWESKFNQVKPVKRAGGRRYYRPADMQLLGGIRQLLHEDGLTIKGVQKILREQGVAHVVQLSPPLEDGGDQVIDSTASEITVLEFRGRHRETAAQEPTKDDVSASEATESTAQELKEEPEPDAEPQEAETAVEDAATEEAAEVAAPEPTADESAPPTQTDDDAESEQSAERDPEPEVAALPSFMHRRAADISGAQPPSETPAADPEPVTSEPAPKRARIVDAPDPPDEIEITATPGVLAHLAKTNKLTPKQVRQMAPIAKELRDWLNRYSGAS